MPLVTGRPGRQREHVVAGRFVQTRLGEVGGVQESSGRAVPAIEIR